jgi:hypothetical protein
MIARSFGRTVLPIVAAALLLAIAERGDSAPRCYSVGRFQLVANDIFDGATGLTWQQNVSARPFTWSDAATYCSTQPGGFRLPTFKELLSIVDYTKPASSTIATINPVAFPNTPADLFWSSGAVTTAEAAAVSFIDSEGIPTDVSAALWVRCVR